MQENGAASPQELKKVASPRGKASGSPRAAAAEAAKVELQRQLASLQKQLDTALHDLSHTRTASSTSEQVGCSETAPSPPPPPPPPRRGADILVLRQVWGISTGPCSNPLGIPGPQPATHCPFTIIRQARFPLPPLGPLGGLLG